jgi:hypothetical protein
MILAQVKAIYTNEMDDLEKHVPDDPERFCVFVVAMVGPRTGEGEESFEIAVCSPKWLEQRIESDGFAIGMHHLFVADYNPAQIRKILTKLIERYSGDSWEEVARKVGKIGRWEFDGPE